MKVRSYKLKKDTNKLVICNRKKQRFWRKAVFKTRKEKY